MSEGREVARLDGLIRDTDLDQALDASRAPTPPSSGPSGAKSGSPIAPPLGCYSDDAAIFAAANKREHRWLPYFRGQPGVFGRTH